jgi:hypothetical protein
MLIQRMVWRNKIPLQTNNYSFEKVSNFTYLGSILNGNNQIQLEIYERIWEGNRAYYANAELLKSKSWKGSPVAVKDWLQSLLSVAYGINSKCK